LNKKRCFGGAPGKEFYADYHDNRLKKTWNNIRRFYNYLCLHASGRSGQRPPHWLLTPLKECKIMFSRFVSFCLIFSAQLSAYYWQEAETPTIHHLIPIELTSSTSGINPIDAIYVINLDRRPDRMEYMNQLLSSWGIYGNRVSACDGRSQVSDELIRELTGPYSNCMLYKDGYGPCSGAIGCLISHLSVIKDASERGFGIIWVLEDDVEVVSDLHQIPQLLSDLSSIDPDWDIFYTDPNPHFPSGAYWSAPDMKSRPRRPDQPIIPFFDLPQKEARGENIDSARWHTGCHSMIISKKGVQRILNYFSHVYLYDHIDRELHLIPNIRLYSSQTDIVTNSFGNPLSQKSDLQYKRP